jgi:hemerythrin
MSGQHSLLAPSDAHRWVNCVGAIAASKGKKDEGSRYADEGTRAHDLASKWLQGEITAVPSAEDDENDMGEFVAIYTNAIRREADGKVLLVEQKVEISQWTSEPKGKGTADAIIVDLATGDISVNDLKYGMGVMVYAQENEQLMLYGLGALVLVEALLVDKVRDVILVIHQPRRDHVDEWKISREDLVAWGAKAHAAGTQALALYADPSKLTAEHFKPEPTTCRWCTIKADCPAVTKLVHDTVIEDFKDLTLKPANADPAPTKKMLDLIGEWVKAVTAHVEERLNQGLKTPGWKLVQGKPGNRAWKDKEAEEKAEALAKQLRMKVDDIYNKKLKTAPQMEKVVPGAEWKTVNKSKVRVDKKWAQFGELIGRSDAKPVLAGEEDPRPAIQMAGADSFADLDAKATESVFD